jgi:hypothetical protein
MPVSTAPVAKLAVDVARFLTGVSGAAARAAPEALPSRSTFSDRASPNGLADCNGVEGQRVCMAKDSAVAETRRRRLLLGNGGGVLERLDPTDELEGKWLGPLVMRLDGLGGAGLVPSTIEERDDTPFRPDWIEALDRSLPGTGGRLETDVVGLAISAVRLELLLSDRTRLKSSSARFMSFSVLFNVSRKSLQREPRSAKRRKTVPLDVCRCLVPFSRLLKTC